LRNRNLSNVYANKIASTGYIVPARFLVREYVSKKDVERAITTANTSLRGGSGKRGEIRLQPTSKVEDKEKFTQDFIDTLGELKLELVGDVIKPGDPESPSSKFPSYKVKDDEGNTYIITLAGGSFSNAGMAYERKVEQDLKTYFENKEEGATKPEFLEQLEQFLDVEFEDISKESTFERRVKRPLSAKGPQDKGDEIADITLIDIDGDSYYISLKAIGGKTVSNAGATGMFDIKDNEIIFTNKEKGNIGGVLMQAGNVNVDAVLRGLNDYKNKTRSVDYLIRSHKVTDEANPDQLIKFLGSAFDYGYIYVKQKNTKNDLEIADLTTEDKLYDFIGNIEDVFVKYPYYISDARSRKHISVGINTDKGSYSFDIRNAAGGLIPNQINLVRGGTIRDIAAMKSNISALGRGAGDVETLLSND